MHNLTKRYSMILLVFLGFVGYLLFFQPSRFSPQSKAAPQEKSGQDNTDERTAIRKSIQGFTKAFEEGDAKKLASFWTENGEYTTEEGETLRGRKSIEESYAKTFKDAPERKIKVSMESLRFPSSVTAVEEGTATVWVKGVKTSASKYSVLHVKENGKWQMAIVREWSTETAGLTDLNWLIGSWVAKRENVEVLTTYEWWQNKAFIRAEFTVKQKDHVLTGTQIIGQDPATGELRSWTFSSDGSFGATTWAQIEENEWHIDSAAVQGDGSIIEATNILKQVDENTMSWQSVNRVIEGLELEDQPPVKVQRVKK